MMKMRIHTSTYYILNVERDNQSFGKPVDLHRFSINLPTAFEWQIFSERIPLTPTIDHEKFTTIIQISFTLNANGWLNDRFALYKQLGMMITSGIDKSVKQET